MSDHFKCNSQHRDEDGFLVTCHKPWKHSGLHEGWTGQRTIWWPDFLHPQPHRAMSDDWIERLEAFAPDDVMDVVSPPEFWRSLIAVVRAAERTAHDGHPAYLRAALTQLRQAVED